MNDLRNFDDDPEGAPVDEQEMFVLFKERRWQPAQLTDKALAKRYAAWLDEQRDPGSPIVK